MKTTKCKYCDQPPRGGRGMCKKHYNNWYNAKIRLRGDFLTTPSMIVGMKDTTLPHDEWLHEEDRIRYIFTANKKEKFRKKNDIQNRT